MHEQGTEEWHAARAGKVTASRIADVMASGRGNKPSATRANYLAQLVTERLTGQIGESYTNAAMQWGTDHEDQARANYELDRMCVVEPVGFIDHPVIAMSGASPDGLVGENGLVEFKCPNTATHIATLMGGSIDRRYMLQMQFQMACTERGWCDFVSFDPRMPVEMQMHVTRIDRDKDTIAEMEQAIAEFQRELDDTIAALRQKYKEAA